MSLVTVDDIAVTTAKEITEPAKKAQVEDWINDAETVITARLGPLNKLNENLTKLVIKQSVARRFLNPLGKTFERLDDYSYNVDPETAKAALFISNDEWALLAPQDTNHGAFSIIPGMKRC